MSLVSNREECAAGKNCHNRSEYFGCEMWGKKKSKGSDAKQIENLEDCITDRNVMLRFILHLDKQYALDNFTFWLETRMQPSGSC